MVLHLRAKEQRFASISCTYAIQLKVHNTLVISVSLALSSDVKWKQQIFHVYVLCIQLIVPRVDSHVNGQTRLQREKSVAFMWCHYHGISETEINWDAYNQRAAIHGKKSLDTVIFRLSLPFNPTGE